jgi:hypothetical protein
LQNPGSSDNVDEVYRVHEFKVTVNGIVFIKVTIDTHFEKKHKAIINDEVILELVRLLDHKTFRPDSVTETGFKYFVNEDWIWDGKPYRLIWFIPPDESYLGVRNAFRRPK